MNYAKPEITSLASASFVIQNQTQKAQNYSDTTQESAGTPPAYDADE
jgi:hypothetical protein